MCRLRRLTFFGPPCMYVCTCTVQGGPKSEPHMLYTQRRQILADFQNYFTVTVSRKLAMQQSLNIPPHLKRVATLPCENNVCQKASVSCGAKDEVMCRAFGVYLFVPPCM